MLSACGLTSSQLRLLWENTVCTLKSKSQISGETPDQMREPKELSSTYASKPLGITSK